MTVTQAGAVVDVTRKLRNDVCPCPFCGNQQITMMTRAHQLEGIYTYQFLCESMECQMLVATLPQGTVAEAIAVWNTRSSEDTSPPTALEDLPVESCFQA